MIKVLKIDGVKTGEKVNAKDVIQKIFYNFDESAGTEIELSEKEEAYIKRANTQFLKAQKILKEAYNAQG